jgi:ABC-type Na+ efflux pump permease subunit
MILFLLITFFLSGYLIIGMCLCLFYLIDHTPSMEKLISIISLWPGYIAFWTVKGIMNKE